MKQTILVLVLAFSAAACAKGGDWQRSNQATYTVPVPDELKPLAAFALTDLKVRKKDGVREIEYTLPKELTGRDVQIEASSSKQDPDLLIGDTCVMKCTDSECAVIYPRLQLKTEEVRAFLETQGFQGEELENRMKVFGHFRGGDPAGVIHF